MLLWLPPPSAADDDEKSGKLRRQARRRTMNALACLASLCLVFLVTLLQINVEPAPARVRHGREDHALAVVDEFHGLNLPPNSIYRMTVEDSLGDPVSLADYAGKVTLVVNTACK